NQASPVLLFLRIARFAVGHEDALLSEGLHHGCQERDPPDRHSQQHIALGQNDLRRNLLPSPCETGLIIEQLDKQARAWVA
ncbi:MAG TPA: hypothetical protein VH592_00600, partial [Gemmataceae bacterium]